MSITDNKIISLNSAAATLNNGTMKSNVYFNFTGLLTDEKVVRQSYVSIVNAQIPVSYYVINATNNLFNYTYNSVPHSYVIPEGNYNATTLISTMTGLITSTPITIIINKLTGVLTFSSVGNFVFIYTNNSIMPVLGFTKANTPSILNTTYNLTAPYPLNLLGIKLIEIKSSALNVSSFDSVGLNSSNTLVSIPSDNAPFNMLSYISYNSLDSHILRQKILNGIDIVLTDENNNYIDFHNVDWTITLCLSIIKDEENAISNDLKQVLSNNELDDKIDEIIKEKSIDEQELDILES